MANFLTADTHFGHHNPETGSGILVNDPDRAALFRDIKDHDRTLISNINDTLGPGDILWHLGDVAWTVEALEWFWKNLRDKIQVRLIRGNHDDKTAWKYRRRFHTADESLYTEIEGHKIHLSHYAHRVWRNSYRGSYHAYGHSHGQLPGIGKSRDVGVNCTGFAPISVADFVASLDNKPDIDHHPTTRTSTPRNEGPVMGVLARTIPPYLGNEHEFKSFDDWKAAGYRILRGSKSQVRVGGTPMFHESQVWDPSDYEDYDDVGWEEQF